MNLKCFFGHKWFVDGKYRVCSRCNIKENIPRKGYYVITISYRDKIRNDYTVLVSEEENYGDLVKVKIEDYSPKDAMAAWADFPTLVKNSNITWTS